MVTQKGNTLGTYIAYAFVNQMLLNFFFFLEELVPDLESDCACHKLQPRYDLTQLPLLHSRDYGLPPGSSITREGKLRPQT